MSTQAQAASRKRLVHQLDTPYSTTSWPEISSDDQDTILELLCSFLGPLGQHRKVHVKPSKGKRAAKRDRKAAAESSESRPAVDAPILPKHEIEDSVDVGFNSITRNLETHAAASQESTDMVDEEVKKAYSMVFVARGNQSSAFNCHFPQMVGMASKNLSQVEKTRLIGFSKPCSDRLSSTLGLPRVSSIAVRCDAPGADALLTFVRKNVAPIDVPWVDGNMDIQYQTTQINSIETTVGTKRVKQV
ncbi:hypothetical protein PT974_10543 [Cladobotryum mycophilum]|uniref:RNase P subunit Pop3 n=1 Tax=Cladobotryum mycophilum TaxID=491253 RepID=A0ABR0SB80_9HYPO